jgi:hypothetical protein
MQEIRLSLVHPLYARIVFMLMFCNGDVVDVCTYVSLNIVSVFLCVCVRQTYMRTLCIS